MVDTEVQMALPGTELAMSELVHPEGALSIGEKFEMFHAANPWIAAELTRMARELRAVGHRRVGLKMLFEVLRYRYARELPVSAEPFRLNNNFTSRYARLIMESCPDLDGAFETRRLHS